MHCAGAEGGAAPPLDGPLTQPGKVTNRHHNILLLKNCDIQP